MNQSETTSKMENTFISNVAKSKAKDALAYCICCIIFSLVMILVPPRLDDNIELRLFVDCTFTTTLIIALLVTILQIRIILNYKFSKIYKKLAVHGNAEILEKNIQLELQEGRYIRIGSQSYFTNTAILIFDSPFSFIETTNNLTNISIISKPKENVYGIKFKFDNNKEFKLYLGDKETVEYTMKKAKEINSNIGNEAFIWKTF